MAVTTIIKQLNLQKKALGMSHAIIAQRSHVSEPTVTRILSGKHPSAHFDHVLAIAAALGIKLNVSQTQDPEEMKSQQARQKADYIMKLVRGNAALEATETSAAAQKRMRNKTINELMAGSKRALWA